MTLHECVAGLMVRHGMMGKRPNGFAIALTKSTYVREVVEGRQYSARFRAADVLAEDWQIYPLPAELQESSESS